ncbi:MAG TPA: family 1 encapsulin nanocompartment shell protein [Solirubrobacteraceae bacterium]|nr:family 1 encapsulin nanocompartment shell protein [Solirubrobacteraceae bacterium]
MSDHLLRDRAPVTDAAWGLLDEEAKSRLTPALAARKLVDFDAPQGWEHSATNLGRVQPLSDAPADGVQAAQRRVLPLVELRAPFTVARDELDAAGRGAADVDLEELAKAAQRIARAENVAVFHGYPDAGITGIAEACRHEAIILGDDFDAYARHVAEAVETLLKAGIGGPYGLALGPDGYTGVIQTTEHGGFPLFDHLKKILAGGPIVWSPGVKGALVLSVRGGDFLFESGQDLSIGYADHDADTVHLYLEESFSFRVATPEAACALLPS